MRQLLPCLVALALALPLLAQDLTANDGEAIFLDGDTLTVSFADLSPLRSLAGFMNGAHVTLVDPPTSERLVMNAVYHDDPPGMTAQFLDLWQRELGLNALRSYDAYWWSGRGAEAELAICQHFGLGTGDVSTFVQRWPYPTAEDIIDFCGEHNLDLAMVVETIYWDEQTGKVYETRQVARNVDGVLPRAAETNAARLARHYAKMGYSNRLVLEIGNEGIGYGKDPLPTDEEYARLAIAFCEAIKRACPQVETAVVGRELATVLPMPNLEYSYSHGQFRRFLSSLRAHEAAIDHFVVHQYHWRAYEVGLSTVTKTKTHLRNFVADLDACGFSRSGIVLTEYNESLWDPAYTRSYAAALAQTAKQMAMIANPRVTGIFVHYAVGGAFLDHSDGALWASYPSGKESYQAGKTEHLPDTRPDLGPRWRVLADGAAVSMLSRVLTGDLFAWFSWGEQGEISGIIAGSADDPRLLVMNNREAPLTLQLEALAAPYNIAQLTSTSMGHPVDDPHQPWSTRTFTADDLVPLPAYSITVLSTQ
jgi:hypothetical protein